MSAWEKVLFMTEPFINTRSACGRQYEVSTYRVTTNSYAVLYVQRRNNTRAERVPHFTFNALLVAAAMKCCCCCSKVGAVEDLTSHHHLPKSYIESRMHRCTTLALMTAESPQYVVVPRFYIGSYTYEYRCRLFHPNEAAKLWSYTGSYHTYEVSCC